MLLEDGVCENLCAKPYDHVMFDPGYSTEVDLEFDMVVVDLVETMRERWSLPSPYPGNSYDHNEFRKFYSDHHPVVFRLGVLRRVPETTRLPNPCLAKLICRKITRSALALSID